MRAHPETKDKPRPYVLGASGSTAEIAAQAGLGFTFAHFINPRGDGQRAAKAYRAAFRPTDFSTQSSTIVAVFVAVGSTEEEAKEFADAFHLWLAYAESPQPFDRVPSLETTRAHRWRPDEMAVRAGNKGRLISGTGPQVVEQLRELAAGYETDEVMINLMMPGETARLNAIKAISAAMDSDAATSARGEPADRSKVVMSGSG
jgi:alkanesulfonate monooxygenase SsuD/methylene tetrahydromethanopterin reductase-like flavin-dependent oxidoreductase (luciferase family)